MSGYFFSATRGFLHSEVHDIENSDIPLKGGRYTELRAAQASGYTIIADGNGEPIAVKDELTRETVESRRAAAYANPMTGSDKLFSEAQRMQLMGDEGWQEALERAISRYEEIREQNPWPQGDEGLSK